MKKSILLAASALVAFGAGAQEVGRVLSSVPVIQQVAVPRQVCGQESVVVEQPKTGAGAVMGAIAGGAVGHNVGGGSGRAAATALGVIGGALLGNNIEGSSSQVQNVTHCTTQTFYENRTVGYNVTYEYAGKQYTVQLPQDPGPTIRLQVTPISATETPAPEQTVAAAPVVTAPAIVESSTVYVPQPVYPAYYARPYYPTPYYYGPSTGVSVQMGYRRWH